MDIVTILVALVLAFLAWKLVTGMVKFGLIAVILLIVYRSVHAELAERGVEVVMPHIGEFATSMEMAGLSITVMALDDELSELLAEPASTPFYTNANK